MATDNSSLLLGKNLTQDISTNSSIDATVFCQMTKSDGIEGVILRIYLLAVFIFATIGNCSVCYILGRKKLGRGGDAFIVSLALSDLVYTISFPFIFFLWMSGIAIGYNVFVASSILIFGSMIVTAYTHAIISCDRFWAIVKPFEARRITKEKKLLACASVWLLGYAISPLSGLEPPVMSVRSQIVQVVRCCVNWVIPLVVMCIFYARCAVTLSSKKPVPNSASSRRMKDAKKITRMFFIIVLVYCVLTMPIAICLLARAMNFLMSDGRAVSCASYDLLTRVLTNLSISNGCVNPIIYAKNHPDIRRLVKGVFKACCCRGTARVSWTPKGGAEIGIWCNFRR